MCAGLCRHDRVLATTDELGADLLGQDLVELVRRAVLEGRNADRADVVGQKRSATRERIAATGARDSRQTRHSRKYGAKPVCHPTTTETRRPFATTTFFTA